MGKLRAGYSEDFNACGGEGVSGRLNVFAEQADGKRSAESRGDIERGTESVARFDPDSSVWARNKMFCDMWSLPL
jgi:hypothetical protein